MRGFPRGLVTTAGLLLVLGAGSVGAAPTELGRITAKAGILVDRATGTVIWEREADLPLPPASTTKVMTALVALESARLHDTLRVSPSAAQVSPSKLHLRPGWQLGLSDLVKALLLNSANDAAEVVAEGVAGSVDAFADRMNGTARRLGALRSNFVNPHGLPADGHLSTARDLTVIFDAALRNSIFRQVVSTKRSQILPIAGSKRPIALRNHNRLLDSYRVPVVGKTGWTLAAKKCFVGAALTGDDNALLVAVLGSRDLWGDLTKLLDYGMATERAPEPVLQVAQIEDGAGRETDAMAAGDSDEDERAATAESEAAAGAFRLQLAAFRRLAGAEKLRASVARGGLDAKVRNTGSAKRPLYKVVIDGFASREAAEAAARRVRQRHPDLRPLVVARIA